MNGFHCLLFHQTTTTFSSVEPLSELTRGSSTGSGGKGHVKSASVSSPGPSAETATANDPLRQRYRQIVLQSLKIFRL